MMNMGKLLLLLLLLLMFLKILWVVSCMVRGGIGVAMRMVVCGGRAVLCLWLLLGRGGWARGGCVGLNWLNCVCGGGEEVPLVYSLVLVMSGESRWVVAMMRGGYWGGGRNASRLRIGILFRGLVR